MEDTIRRAIFRRVAEEPFAVKFGLELLELDLGRSKVRMTLTPEMRNIFDMPHGGAIFALIDEAFETASNSYGTVAVALSMSVTFIAAADIGATLIAEATEVSRTRKTSNYDIKVRAEDGRLIASCMALAYRKGTPLPFIVEPGR